MSDTALNKIIQYGTRSARLAFTPNPATGSKVLYLWYETDFAPNMYAWNGSAWVDVNPDGGITQLTGHVLAGPGAGSVVATIPADVVTNNMLVDVGPNTIKGRLGGTGTVQDLNSNQASIVLDSATDPFVRTSALPAVTPDEVFIGPNDPGAPIELWYDTDAVLPVGGVSTVSRGITLAGTITPGLKGIIRLPFNCTIVGWSLMLDVAASIEFDVKVGTPPTLPSTSIVASTPPKVTSAIFASDTTLTGWVKNFIAGDTMSFTINTITGTPGFVVLQIDLISR